MSVKSCEKLEKSKVVLTIEVGAEEFEAAINKAYLKMRGKIAVAGFRPGKAPRKMIEKLYGVEVFYEEAVNIVLPDAYEAAVKEQDLQVVGYPDVELVDCGKDGVTFKATVSVYPEVKLGQYKGLEAPRAEVKVMAADVNARLKEMAERNGRMVSVERAVKKGDTATIDFEGFDNGVPFEGGKGENFDLEIGSGSFVPGFEEQLIGMTAGEEKDIDITFPENYTPELAGKPVVFHVKVNEVKEAQLPELDDEFAKDVSEFETMEAFRADLGNKLAERRAQQAEADFANQIMEQVVANMECEVPDGMIEVEIDRMLEQQAMQLQQYGISMEQYQQMMGVNEAMVRDSARPDALKSIQLRLALGAIAQAEGIEVTEEELEAEFKKLADQYQIEIEKVKAAIAAEDLKNDLLMQKAQDLVVTAAKAKKKTTRKKKTDEAEEPKAE